MEINAKIVIKKALRDTELCNLVKNNKVEELATVTKINPDFIRLHLNDIKRWI